MYFNRPEMWEIFPTVVFTYNTYGEEVEEENFFWTTLKMESAPNALSFLPGARTYSFKEIFINFGFRKTGIIGTGEKSRIIRIQCPYCYYVQDLLDESQRCGLCTKSFYAY